MTVRRAGARVGRRFGGSARRLSEAVAAQRPAERLVAMSGWLPPDERATLTRGPLARLDGGAALRAVDRISAGTPNGNPLATTLYIDAQLALPDDMLHYFDRTSMAHSLEVRVPFLDHELVEYCARIPTNLKVHHLTTKHVLKHAARGILPDHIIDKRKIGFFRGTTGAWLDAQLPAAIEEYLVGSTPLCSEFIDSNALASLSRDSRGKSQLLISILLLEVWLRTFLPLARSRPAAGARATGIA